ncbi:MAG: hypothetical protein ACTTJC_06835 [Campylobacter sp.]
MEHNKILSIRNIEQSLENISNATLGEVDISLSPSKNFGSTDVKITRQNEILQVALNLI